MQKAILRTQFGCLGELGDTVDVLSFNEVKSYPNISNDVIDTLQGIIDDYDEPIIGYVKSIDYTDEEPDFIQMYDGEVDFIEEN